MRLRTETHFYLRGRSFLWPRLLAATHLAGAAAALAVLTILVIVRLTLGHLAGATRCLLVHSVWKSELFFWCAGWDLNPRPRA